MPYHVGLEENVQRGITTSQRPGLSEAGGALTDPGAPEEVREITLEMALARSLLFFLATLWHMEFPHQGLDPSLWQHWIL